MPYVTQNLTSLYISTVFRVIEAHTSRMCQVSLLEAELLREAVAGAALDAEGIQAS